MEERNKMKNKAKIPYGRNSSKIKNQNRKKRPNRYPLYTNKSKNKQTRKADKMNITKCHNVETVPESNTKIVTLYCRQLYDFFLIITRISKEGLSIKQKSFSNKRVRLIK
jgi:phage terminase small subunit